MTDSTYPGLKWLDKTLLIIPVNGTPSVHPGVRSFVNGGVALS